MDVRIGIEELQAHAASLSRLARRLAGDGSDAEDLVQDTWVKALVQPPHASASVRSLKAWLGTVLRNRHREVLRSKSLQHEHESAAARVDRVDHDPGDIEERLRLHSALARALHELPEPMRAAVTLRYLDEHSGPEVARMLGLSHEALRQRLSRGLARLRERLDRELESRDAWMLVALGRPARSVPTTVPPTLIAATLMSTTTKFFAAGIALVLAIAAIFVWNQSAALDATARHDLARPDVALDPVAEKSISRTASQAPRTSIDGAVTIAASPLLVDREHDLFGLVLGPDETPITGANVRVMRNESSGWHVDDVAEFDRYTPVASSITRADGGFAIRLDRGRAYSLFVDAAGFAPAHLGLRNAGERVVVHLGPAGAVDVHVLRSDGSPLAAGRVSITSRPAGASDERWRIRRVDLGADGRAHVADLPCESLGVEVAPADASWPLWTDVTVVPDHAARLEIVLPKGDEVRGRVVDARTHIGIAGARVGAPKWFGSGVLTDLDGAFVIPALSPDFGLVHVDAPGYAHASVNARGDDRIVDPLVIELHAGRSVSGRVVDTNGAPVPEAYVAATGSAWRDRDMQHDWIGTRSDEHGLFRIVDLDPELAHTLVARKDGFGAATFDLPAYEAGSDSVQVGDLVLQPPGVVSGHVIDSKGTPIADVRVELSGSSADRAILPGAVHPLIDPGTEARHVRTDDIGRFVFGDVAAGNYTLRVPGDEDHTPTSPLALEVTSGQERAGIDIECAVALTIRGRVTGPDGRPLAATVRAVPVGPSERANGAESDSDGVFVVRGVIAGPHDLVIAPKDGTIAAPISLRIDAGAPEIRVSLPDLAFVRGRILDEAGGPCAKAWVQLVDTRCDQAMSSTQSATDGTFEIAIARGATWELEAISRKLADGTKLRAIMPDVAARDGLEVVVRRVP